MTTSVWSYCWIQCYLLQWNKCRTRVHYCGRSFTALNYGGGTVYRRSSFCLFITVNSQKLTTGFSWSLETRWTRIREKMVKFWQWSGTVGRGCWQKTFCRGGKSDATFQIFTNHCVNCKSFESWQSDVRILLSSYRNKDDIGQWILCASCSYCHQCIRCCCFKRCSLSLSRVLQRIYE